MDKNIDVIEGVVEWKEKFWDDDSDSHYEIGSDNIISILNRFDGKNVRITIEVIE